MSSNVLQASTGAQSAGHQPEERTPLLRARGLAKAFAGNAVLHSVDLDLYAGEVVGLLGENGAGKSTLMHVLSGGLTPDAGVIEFNGNAVKFNSLGDGIAAGISFVHQELSVIGALSVAENLFLGRLPRTRLGLVDHTLMRASAKRLLERVGAGALDPAEEAGRLRAGEQQLIEIAKAADRMPALLILDEPTSSLTPHEVEKFLDYVNKARQSGTAIIFITHRLEEALRLCDRLVVLRNGSLISERRSDDTNKAQLIADMTGKSAIYEYSARAIKKDDVALSLRSVSDRGHLNDISFEVRKGEVVGLFGLVGAGRTELLEVIHGARACVRGEMKLDGTDFAPSNPNEAVRRGTIMVPEGRKTAGILPTHSVRDNVTVSSLRQFAGWVFSNRRGEQGRMAEYTQSLGIRMTSDGQTISTLSGGNQQKVLFARALMTNPKVLLLDEPTHGVDVGAKAEIYSIISNAAQRGMAVLMASSEVPEILALCDRVAVLSSGQLAGILERHEMTEDAILTLAFRGHSS